MSLDGRVFFFGEAGRLIEDSIRNADLAYVMQERENIDLVLLCIRVAAAFCDHPGILSNAA